MQTPSPFYQIYRVAIIVLTIDIPGSAIRQSILLAALIFNPLSLAQNVAVPSDAASGESVDASLTLEDTASVNQDPVRTQTDTNEDVLIVDAAGASSIESSGNIRIATFRDSVRFRQGLIEIFGDTARLEQDIVTGDLIKVTVEGDPARFIRSGETSTDTITGHSESIEYYYETLNSTELSVVEFIGSASFNRGRTAFECTRIKHIIESGATDSPGPCSGLLAPTSAQADQTDDSED
jgi:lipopolysaccharide transport protein LptA